MESKHYIHILGLGKEKLNLNFALSVVDGFDDQKQQLSFNPTPLCEFLKWRIGHEKKESTEGIDFNSAVCKYLKAEVSSKNREWPNTAVGLDSYSDEECEDKSIVSVFSFDRIPMEVQIVMCKNAPFHHWWLLPHNPAPGSFQPLEIVHWLDCHGTISLEMTGHGIQTAQRVLVRPKPDHSPQMLK